VTQPRNVVASVLARLRNIAQEAGLSFNDILQAYVIERFLARLARSPHVDTVLLKGALMLRIWGVPRARPTMDIDLLRRGIADQAALVQLVEQCAALGDPSDGVTFEPTTISVEPIGDATEYVGTRIRLQARLDNVRQTVPAFVRRIGEPALANDFSRVVADLAEYLMPAAKAAATSANYPVRWEPPGPWQHG
jgi:Nucleotidyl transferase AbiEii toxin, Type IV TA system